MLPKTIDSNGAIVNVSGPATDLAEEDRMVDRLSQMKSVDAKGMKEMIGSLSSFAADWQGCLCTLSTNVTQRRLVGRK